MTKPSFISGWKLDREQRDRLLRYHPPKYANTVAEHITLAVGDHPVPSNIKAAIVGRSDDDSGVEAMVVTVDGTVDRPDGSTFHITWSLADGHRARESNDVLKARGWKELDHPVSITVTPGQF